MVYNETIIRLFTFLFSSSFSFLSYTGCPLCIDDNQYNVKALISSVLWHDCSFIENCTLKILHVLFWRRLGCRTKWALKEIHFYIRCKLVVVVANNCRTFSVVSSVFFRWRMLQSQPCFLLLLSPCPLAFSPSIMHVWRTVIMTFTIARITVQVRHSPLTV